MRQLLKTLLIAGLLTPHLARAFNDAPSVQAVTETKSLIMSTKNSEARKHLLWSLRKAINTRLNTIEIPDISQVQVNDPRVEDYRSLTEFEGYLDLISLTRLNEKECRRAQVRVEASSSTNGFVSKEARYALELLQALCTF